MVDEEQTTLVCDNESPTNQPDGLVYPKCYVSLRLTIAHDQFDLILEHIKLEKWYLCYPHFGKDGTNQHWHVLLPGSDKRDVEKFRRRFKKLGYTGNKYISAKLNENGLSHGIQYCSKEGTEPKTGGDVQQWIDQAPKWLNANLKDALNVSEKRKSSVKRDDSTDGMTPITSKGCLYQCWKYRRDVIVVERDSMAYSDISDVLLHMLDSQKYYFAPEFVRGGLPDFYIDVFKDSCKKNRLTFKGVQRQWMQVIFRPINSRW